MDKKEALYIINKFNHNDNPSKDDEFLFVEASNYLIETEEDKDVIVQLGGYYYGKGKYELAEKYYLKAYELGDTWAPNGLGYIYYYGRVGVPDYKKAFFYYSKAKENGNNEAAMKIADMYHNGYGVEKNEKKYKELLLEIYEKIKTSTQLNEPFPEVAHRLADIYIKENKSLEALPLLLRGKEFLAQRIRYNPFWGNFVVMRRIINLLYEIIDIDDDHLDFFDLFLVLKEENEVDLFYAGNKYEIKSFFEEGQMRISCEGKYYKSVEDFLINALFEDKHTYIIEFDNEFYKLRISKKDGR